MKFALYRRGEEKIVECPTMDEVWAFVRENGFCSEEVVNDALPPRRILNPQYEIHTFATNGELIAMSRTRLSFAPEEEW
jgi:hypothetical protein